MAAEADVASALEDAARTRARRGSIVRGRTARRSCAARMSTPGRCDVPRAGIRISPSTFTETTSLRDAPLLDAGAPPRAGAPRAGGVRARGPPDVRGPRQGEPRAVSHRRGGRQGSTREVRGWANHGSGRGSSPQTPAPGGGYRDDRRRARADQGVRGAHGRGVVRAPVPVVQERGGAQRVLQRESRGVVAGWCFRMHVAPAGRVGRRRRAVIARGRGFAHRRVFSHARARETLVT